MKAWLKKCAQQSVLAVLAAFLAVSGISFLSVAAYLALARLIGPPRAALVVGVAYLLLALIVVLILRLRGARRVAGRKLKEGKKPASELDAALGAMLGRDTGDWVRRHGRKASLAALAAGVAFGASPGLRNFIERIGRELSERDRE